MVLQKFRSGQRIFDMTLHAHTQRLNPLQEEERVKRAHAWAKIAQALYPGADDKRNWSESLAKVHAMVCTRRLGQLREIALLPRELAAVDDDAAYAVAVAAHEFCQ